MGDEVGVFIPVDVLGTHGENHKLVFAKQSQGLFADIGREVKIVLKLVAVEFFALLVKQLDFDGGLVLFQFAAHADVAAVEVSEVGGHTIVAQFASQFLRQGKGNAASVAVENVVAEVRVGKVVFRCVFNDVGKVGSRFEVRADPNALNKVGVIVFNQQVAVVVILRTAALVDLFLIEFGISVEVRFFVAVLLDGSDELRLVGKRKQDDGAGVLVIAKDGTGVHVNA